MSTAHEGDGAGRPAAAPSIFQCGLCQQRYKRPDHLARHVRSHSQYRPHRCPICRKGFSRTDLLKRHITSHDKQNDGPNAISEGGHEVHPRRVTQACRACALNHLRCTELKPCRRCTQKRIECTWDQPLFEVQDDVSPVRMAQDEIQDQLPQLPSQEGEEQRPQCQEPYQQDAHSGLPSSPERPTLRGVQGVSDCSDLQAPPTPQSQQHPSTESSSDTHLPPSELQPQGHNQPNTPLLGYPLGPQPPLIPDWNFLPGWQCPAGATPDFGWTVPDVELDDVDVQFLDVYNTSVPFELGYDANPTSLETYIATGEGVRAPPAEQDFAFSRPEAFQRHYWLFRPNVRDCAGAEEPNLSLPADPYGHASPESRISVGTRATTAKLTVSARDQILAIVIKGCRPENMSRAFRSFPSVELLDKLLQYYLTSPIARADTFLHAATFNPNEKRPELLLAMVAAGAVLTSDSALSKLGYALQESVRPAVASLWEGNNALTRNLELIQAFIIHLEIGIWSGHGRKIEITESFLQAPLTMLRRAGKFKHTAYQDTSPSIASDVNGIELHALWQSWVDQECFKRTAFRLLTHDTSSSMCLMVSPLLSYAEISLPLPCAPGQWTASSAEQWRAMLPAPHGPPPPQTAADYLDDPAAYNNAHGTRPAPFDVAMANQALLSCAWSLAWECIQLKGLCAVKPRRWNSFLLFSRQEEIVKLLRNSRFAMDEQTPDSLGMRIRLEHILLHMHASLEDIQIFAGVEGPEQAPSARALVLGWAKSEAGRQAVSHAGQIVQVARRLSKGAIQGPPAFAVYHAGLVLWAYGLVLAGEDETSRSRLRRSQAQLHAQNELTVWLDEDGESLALQKFTQLGTGRPCFRGAVSSDGPVMEVSLEEPDEVMRALVSVVATNHDGLPRPHLADRLIHLMEALQRSTRIAA